MQTTDLVAIGAKHARNAVAEALYLNAGVDMTRPVSIYGEVVERCNYKCRYCNYWRRPNYREEMSIEQWRSALLDLKSFIGGYHIEFSGGEPYLKKGFLEIARTCRDNGLLWGVTTNGCAFKNARIARATVAARPSNINISIDSFEAATHDYSRGIEGSLGDIRRGLENINGEKAAQGHDFPIVVKPVVHRLNFRDLPRMVDWALENGGHAVNFQPVAGETEETDKELWIEERDLAELERVVEDLIALKRQGKPIVNSETLLRAWGLHFRGQKAPKEAMPCRVGLRTFFIRSDGRVETCWSFPPIGNVKTQTAREIWRSPEAVLGRRETTKCETLCLFTCLSQKTLLDRVKMGAGLFLKRPAQAASAIPAPAAAE